MAAAETGRFAQAVEAIAQAVRFDGARADYHAQHARCLSTLKRDSDAAAALERASAAGPRDAFTWDTVGVVAARLGDHARAAQAFEAAVSAEPGNAGYRFNRAASLRFLGRFEEAEDAYEAAIAADPSHYRAHSALAALRKQTPERNHVERLRALLTSGRADVEGELHLRHAIAKELEDLGRYDEAFADLTAGKARKRAQVGYTIDRDRVLFERVKALFTVDRSARFTLGHPNGEPIFVVGLPRSGTTLIDRILSSHSQVQSAGELQNFGVTVKRMAGTPSREVLDVPTLERSVELDPAGLGARYVESTRTITGRRPRFVDKMPLNFFYVGLIAAALPKASIVVVRREPLDCCIGNYRQLFAQQLPYYRYALDLADLGRYYALFDRLMAHWDAVLPRRVLRVQYERLVADQEGETRRLLAHCGLEFEPACLEFHTNEAPVATASAVQVREPLHSGAIGRWRRYERHLGPLLAELRAAGLALD